MNVDLEKVSEIIFGAVLSGIISGITVVAAYLLGRKQSDRKWNREVEQREKEQKIEKENELNLRRIDALSEVRTFITRLYFQLHECFESSSDGEKCLRDIEELIILLEKTIPLFDIEVEKTSYQTLIDLYTETSDLGFSFWEYLQEEDLSLEDSMLEDMSRYRKFIFDIKDKLKDRSTELIKEFG